MTRLPQLEQELTAAGAAYPTGSIAKLITASAAMHYLDYTADTEACETGSAPAQSCADGILDAAIVQLDLGSGRGGHPGHPPGRRP